jgi:hypothetical protein
MHCLSLEIELHECFEEAGVQTMDEYIVTWSWS